MLTTPFERALVVHWVADSLLQNDWMAHHKSKLSHPAAWVHGAIHGRGLWWALDWRAGLAHTLIDTRIPLKWWTRSFKHSAGAPEAPAIAMWTDQALHIAILFVWIEAAGRALDQ